MDLSLHAMVGAAGKLWLGVRSGEETGVAGVTSYSREFEGVVISLGGCGKNGSALEHTPQGLKPGFIFGGLRHE